MYVYARTSVSSSYSSSKPPSTAVSKLREAQNLKKRNTKQD